MILALATPNFTVTPTLAALVVLAVLGGFMPTVFAQESGISYEYYPCSECHTKLRPSGLSKASEFHGVDLGVGAHASLYCINCHDVDSAMMKLQGGVDIAIPFIHDREDLMGTNSLCGLCHAREYQDYLQLVHGNKTMTCEGGEVYRVLGYKGVDYYLHYCSDYTNLETRPAMACVECHNPHDPVMSAPGVLPEPSHRPPPPNEDPILYGGLPVLAAGLALVALAPVVHRRASGRG